MAPVGTAVPGMKPGMSPPGSPLAKQSLEMPQLTNVGKSNWQGYVPCISSYLLFICLHKHDLSGRQRPAFHKHSNIKIIVSTTRKSTNAEHITNHHRAYPVPSSPCDPLTTWKRWILCVAPRDLTATVGQRVGQLVGQLVTGTLQQTSHLVFNGFSPGPSKPVPLLICV